MKVVRDVDTATGAYRGPSQVGTREVGTATGVHLRCVKWAQLQGSISGA